MKKILGLILSIILFLTTVPVIASSDNTKLGNNTKNDFQKAASYGLIPESLKSADLTKPITHEELAAVAIKLYEKKRGEVPDEDPSELVDSGFSSPLLLKAFKLRITSGVPFEIFKPDGVSTREQMATVFGYTLESIFPTIDLSDIKVVAVKDSKSISEWAVKYVLYMNSQGFITGVDGKFMPGAVATRLQAINTANKLYEKFRVTVRNNNILSEGFPEFIPLVDDAYLVKYFKNTSMGSLSLMLKTDKNAGQLWEFYSNTKLYDQFNLCNMSFDNKIGKISIFASENRTNKMNICIYQAEDKQMYIIISLSIPAGKGNEAFLGSVEDKNEDDYEFYSFAAFIIYDNKGSGFDIGSGSKSPKRDGFKGEIAEDFPRDIPLAQNKGNVGIDKTFQIDDVKYTNYSYRLKIPETKCLEFYMDYRNYSNLEYFELDYENHWGLKNLKVYAKSKAGIMSGITYYYNGNNGTVVVMHNSAENKLYMTL